MLLCYGTTGLVEGLWFFVVAVAGLVVRRTEADHRFHRRLHHFTGVLEHALTTVLPLGLGAVLPVLLADHVVAMAMIGLSLVLVTRPAAGWLSFAGSELKGRDRRVVAIYGVRGTGSIHYIARACRGGTCRGRHGLVAFG